MLVRGVRSMNRTYWYCPTLDATRTDEEGSNFAERFDETRRYEVASEDKANLVGSRLKGDEPEGLHAPVLDLDFPARLVPSTTPGHFHLYLDVAMPWRKYRALLMALCTAGIIEPGYMKASIARRATFVRKPGVVKGPDSPSS